MVHGAVMVTSGERLQFAVQSNEEIVSHPLSAEQQKPIPLETDISVRPPRAEDLQSGTKVVDTLV